MPPLCKFSTMNKNCNVNCSIKLIRNVVVILLKAQPPAMCHNHKTLYSPQKKKKRDLYIQICLVSNRLIKICLNLSCSQSVDKNMVKLIYPNNWHIAKSVPGERICKAVQLNLS